MKNIFTSVFFFLTTLFAAGQNLNPEYDSTLAARLGADELGMKMYVLVILKTGQADINDKALRDSLFTGHFATINALAAEKKLVVAGPLGENKDKYRGIFILDVSSIAEAQTLVQRDPTVINGIFDTELYPWYGSAALPMYLEYSDKISRKGF
ncbi:MAG: YciI family protein [Bacteroidales bacterium]|jgi:uncharacterized protein YciI|nr:YciI family protein [Bacteroidales bacterium]